MVRWGITVLAATALLACGSQGDDDADTGMDSAGAGAEGAAGTGGMRGGSGGTGSGGAGAGGVGGGAGGAEAQALPSGSREYRHVFNLVDAAAAAQLDHFLLLDGDDLFLAPQAFYPLYTDDYDFLFLLSDRDLADSAASGRFDAVRQPPIPGTGVPVIEDRLEFYSAARLKGAIAMHMAPGNTFGPLAHELLHYWANYLDPSLGFGHDLTFDQQIGPHWGLTGVNGQLGGFDASTIHCETPAGAVPPDCTALSNGRYRYVFDDFGVVTNSFKGVDYAPLELYLMGLLPASEVPKTFMVLTEGAFDVDSAMDDDGLTTVEASGIGEIAFADIVARHGERAAASEAEHHFTSAFILVTAEPADQAALDRVALWADIFGKHVPPPYPGWSSFELATGNRATLETYLGARRATDDPFDVPRRPAPKPCDVLVQGCDPGQACYDPGGSFCGPSGGIAQGEPCVNAYDCEAGTVCSWMGETSLCAPYCDLFDKSSPKACDTLCPGAFVIVGDPMTFEDVGAFCLPGASGACDPLAPNCDDGHGCYGLETPSCRLAGATPQGETCSQFGSDCVPGNTCVALVTVGAFSCQPYCDPRTTATGAQACMTLCPGKFWTYDGYGVCQPD